MGEDLTVVRWRRYGKDRLYVNDATGCRVGWVDVATGQVALDQPDLAEAFRAAVHAFRLAAPTAATRSTAAAEAPTLTVPALERDLTENRPGQAAREQAVAELTRMRERSRVGTFLARAFDMKTDERAWRVGAGGEETVGGRLEKLTRHGWHVLHAVPVGDRGSDIDHVLIGWGGVYTINTKTHPGGRVWVGHNAVRVNGHAVPYLRNSRFEAQRAERLLSAAVGFAVPVRPVLVFLTGSLIPNVTIKGGPEDVLILDRMDIPGAFRRAPERLSPEQVEAVFGTARRSTTWRPAPEARGITK